MSPLLSTPTPLGLTVPLLLMTVPVTDAACACHTSGKTGWEGVLP